MCISIIENSYYFFPYFEKLFGLKSQNTFLTKKTTEFCLNTII